MLKLVPVLRRVLSVNSLRQSFDRLKLYYLTQTAAAHSTSTSNTFGMDLKNIVKALEGIAPSSTAEEWDNVGLLLEPTQTKPITHVLLTNDLTEQVLDEALQLKEKGHDNVGLIISYHPPIFRPFKRLTQSSAKDRIIIKAIESKIAIYSPHTAHDALWGGVNDWALSGIKNSGSITPLSVKQVSDKKGLVVEVGGVKSMEKCCLVGKFLEKENKMEECAIHTDILPDGSETYRVKCRGKRLAEFLPAMTNFLSEYKVTVSPGDMILSPGAGRLLTLHEAISIAELVSQVKEHFGIPHVRLALPPGKDDLSMVATVAVCVGSGWSVLKGIAADVLLTGEMSHHEILDAVSRGSVCMLCEHSNTERGFLKVFKNLLEGKLESNVNISISQVDKDPVTVV